MATIDPAGRDVRRALARTVALPVALALLLGAILLGEMLYLLSLQRWVEHTDRVLESTFELEKLLVDRETGVRGFLLTGNPDFLEPYEEAQPKVTPVMDRLEALVSDRSDQAARVRIVRAEAAQWREFARDVVDRRGRGEDFSAIVASARGKRHMDVMRRELEAMLALEQQFRHERVAASNRAARVVLASTAGLTVVLAFVLALVTRRRLIAISESYNQSLEMIERQTEALRQSEDRYRRLVDLSPDGIFVQTQGKIRYANRAMGSILGVSDPSVLIGRDVLEIIHPDYHEVVRERVRDILEQNRDAPLLEERFLRADGSEVWVEVTAAPFQFDSTPSAQVIVRDISDRIVSRAERRRLEAERAATLEVLRHSEQSLAHAQQIAHLGSWDLDIAAGQVKWSDEMYRIFGVDRSFRTTRDAIHPFLHPEDRERVIRAADETIARDAPFNEDHRIVRPDGVVRHVNSQGEVIRDASGRALRLIGTMLDITERKRAEEELRQLNETLEQRVAERTAELREANEDLEAFAYTISHDLRSPMRAMRGFAQALLEDCADGLDESCTGYARRIVAAAARMDRLTEELLEYSQLSRRQLVPQRISLVLVLHEVLGQLKRDPEFARAQIEVVEPMPWVLAHRPTLAAVLSNLLENAAKFVPPDLTPVIAVRAENRGDLTRVWVMDNGIGIAPEHQERIFQVFERLHGLDQYPGTGIGLAIVRRGVERMGGQVGVESERGRGSRFWIELPRDPQSP